MKPTIDKAFAIREEPGPAAAGIVDLAEYRPPKPKLHPMLVAFFATGMATGAFYGAEMFAPSHYKPSYVLGNYEGAMAEARKQGELRAEVRYQGQLKQIETAANQWQEQYKAAANSILQYYQATYARAGVYAQATADIQKQYMSARYQVAVSTTAGDTFWANLADTYSPVIGAFDQQAGEAAQAYAAQRRADALAKLDAAAQAGVVIKVEGWETGLARPDEVAAALRNLPTLKLPAQRAAELESK